MKKRDFGTRKIPKRSHFSGAPVYEQNSREAAGKHRRGEKD